MRFLRLALLQAYISSIQKNKKKALMIINIGIFFSIFAFSSAAITFFIEKKISDIQNELTINQIDARDNNIIISELETELNSLTILIHKEDNNTAKIRFIDEFNVFNKISTTRDYYGSFIYYNLVDFKKELDQMEKELGSNMFDRNDPFYVDEIIPALQNSWNKEEVDNFINSLDEVDEYTKKVLKIDFKNYILQNPLSLEEIINETKNESLNSLNSATQTSEDYTLVYNYIEALNVFFINFLDVLKGLKGQNEYLIEDGKKEILYYSNQERTIISITFIFQFAIFLIIQIFEINSVNFNLKKKIK